MLLRPNNLIQTIERVTLILDVVGQSRQGISIKDLSAKLSLPKGTVHRILASLAYFGYIHQNLKTKNYFLGLKLLDLGSLLNQQLELRQVAEPFLKELAEQTKEAAHMVVCDGDEIVYIDKIETEQETGGLKMASRIGARNPIHSCAAGKALLAFFNPEEADRLIQGKELLRRTANTITNPSRLKDHLKTVFNQGYAVDDEENEEGIRCVGAPVFNDKGAVVAAISISGPAFRVSKKRIQDALGREVLQAAFRISERLGFKRGI